ncbi:MAG: hypothetical protein PHN76_04140 [Advenella sp.]|uniref:hypothetical protein n=1 Tax=Advenella sp. TaxID=1872388 RepID=UPI0025901F55|nr:hypothetical protein [Advenella sp.]MDD3757334.1 hypothetical protein [Advenella sp.]
MGLMALLEKKAQDELAAVKHQTLPSVAEVASVIVASTPESVNKPVQVSQLSQVSQSQVPKKQKPALQEIEYTNRLQYFQAKGISSHEAQTLADRLAKRDKDWIDDRRSCAECLHYYAGKCGQSITLIGKTDIFSLVRCKGFQLEGARND